MLDADVERAAQRVEEREAGGLERVPAPPLDGDPGDLAAGEVEAHPVAVAGAEAAVERLARRARACVAMDAAASPPSLRTSSGLKPPVTSLNRSPVTSLHSSRAARARVRPASVSALTS